MSWLTKLFAPEVDKLTNRLSDCTERELLLLAHISNVEAENAGLKLDLEDEIRMGRKRERKFINIILGQAKAASIPEDEPEPVPPVSTPSAHNNLLHVRCLDYCTQTFGANFTKEEYDAAFEVMKSDPETWLSDENQL